MTDIEDIVGSENMTLAAKERVIELLRALQTPATSKRFLYARWARLVGVQANPVDINRVAEWSQGGI